MITQTKKSLAFRPKDGSFEVTDAAIRRDPEYISNISELWAGHTSRNRFVSDRLYDLQNYPNAR
jgi:hypothetical protein